MPKSKKKNAFELAREREAELLAKKDPFDMTPEELAISSASGNEEPYKKPERPKGKTLSSGAGFWDFMKKAVFIGSYVKDFLRPKDGKGANEKKGDVIGYVFIDEKGHEHIISNSYQIREALTAIQFSKTQTLYIEFLEKVQVKGKPLNRFDIIAVE